MTPEEYEQSIKDLEQGNPMERLVASRVRAAQDKIRPRLKAMVEELYKAPTYQGPGGLKELFK